MTEMLKAAPAVLRPRCGSPPRRCQAAITCVTDREIRAYNRHFLGRDAVTDVIAFPYHRPTTDSYYLGDIIISADQAYAYSDRTAAGYLRELVFLACHGLLHLFGHDDSTRRRRTAMLKRQNQLMAKLIPC